MKKTFFISIIICLFSINLFSQTILLEENVDSESFAKAPFGKNSKNYSHYYIGFDFYLPTDNTKEFQSRYGQSNNFNIGWRYKLRATNWLAFGADIEYVLMSHYLELPLFVDSLDYLMDADYGKQKLKLNYTGAEVYVRFNFGRRGNSIGKFIDFAAYGLYNFYAKHVIFNRLNNQNIYRANTVKIINSNLDYIEMLNYGARFRLGVDRYIFCFSYSLANIFTQEFKQDVYSWQQPRLDLPKLTIGFQLSLH